MTATVALIGTGVMGRAVLRSVISHAGSDRVGVHDALTGPGRQVAADHQVGWADSVSEAVDGADVVIVAVKPHDVPEVLEQMAGALAAGAVVVSVAAGVSTATMSRYLDGGAITVRVMPNTPALLGKGVSVLSAGPHATAEQLELFE